MASFGLALLRRGGGRRLNEASLYLSHRRVTHRGEQIPTTLVAYRRLSQRIEVEAGRELEEIIRVVELIPARCFAGTVQPMIDEALRRSEIVHFARILVIENK